MVNTVADQQRVMDEVEALLSARSVSARRKSAVRLALDELLSNVIQYAYDDGGVHRIGVKIDPGIPFVLAIEDDGRPFDPLSDAPAPVLEGPVEDRPVGGLGLHLLRSMGMEMDYRREKGRNILRVVFPGE